MSNCAPHHPASLDGPLRDARSLDGPLRDASLIARETKMTRSLALIAALLLGGTAHAAPGGRHPPRSGPLAVEPPAVETSATEHLIGVMRLGVAGIGAEAGQGP